jgi:hypothetical protein
MVARFVHHHVPNRLLGRARWWWAQNRHGGLCEIQIEASMKVGIALECNPSPTYERRI